MTEALGQRLTVLTLFTCTYMHAHVYTRTYTHAHIHMHTYTYLTVLIALVCHSGSTMTGPLDRASHTFTACRGGGGVNSSTTAARCQWGQADPVFAAGGVHAAAALGHKRHVCARCSYVQGWMTRDNCNSPFTTSSCASAVEFNSDSRLLHRQQPPTTQT